MCHAVPGLKPSKPNTSLEYDILAKLGVVIDMVVRSV